MTEKTKKFTFNIVEVALNFKAAMKAFFLSMLWLLGGALCFVGIITVGVSIVIIFAATECASSPEGIVCSMNLLSPVFF